MHELSIAQNIIEIINSSISEDQNGKVKTVYLKIGKLGNVVPDSLIFGYNILTKGTELEESSLEIENIPLTIECENCNSNSTLEYLIFICPECSSSKIRTNTCKLMPSTFGNICSNSAARNDTHRRGLTREQSYFTRYFGTPRSV